MKNLTVSRSNVAARLRQLGNSAKSSAGKVAVGAMSLAPMAAFAQGADLAGAVTAEVDTAQLIAIGLIVMTVAGIIMFINSGKRVAK